jgi:hypothetical protein
MTNAVFGTQVIGDVVSSGGIPDISNPPLGGSVLSVFSGDSIGTDKIIFTSLSGVSSGGSFGAWETLSPYKLLAEAGYNPAVNFQYVLPLANLSIESKNFTRNALDTSIFTITASNNVEPQIFNYGDFTYNTINVNGSLQALFPPPYYLTISQGAFPSLAALEDRILQIEASIDLFVEPAINSLVQSIDQIGLTSELISQRVYRLEQGVKIRLDLLADAIETVANALNNYIKSSSVNFKDKFGQDFSQQFVAFLIVDGPKVAVASAGLVGVDENFISIFEIVSEFQSFDIVNDRYRSAYFEQSVRGLITKAIQYAKSGDEESAILNGSLGMLLFNEMRKNFVTLDVSLNMGKLDNEAFNLGFDGTDFLSPEMQQNLLTLDPGSVDRTLLATTTENVETLTQEANSLLLQLNALGAQLGIPPVSQYDTEIF